MTTTTSRERVRTILRQRVAADVFGLPVVWGLLVAGVTLFVGAVAVLRTGGIEVSGWEQAAQIARWYAGAVGVYVAAVHLPLYIAHGYTRREFAVQVPAFIAAWAATFALLMTAGFALETLAYRVFGWTQALTGTHLYASPTQYPLVFIEFLLVGIAWTVGGAVLGAAFYRSALLGLGLIPVALLLVGLVETAAGPGYFGPFPAVGLGWLPGVGPALGGGSVGWAVLVTAGVSLLGLALAWAVARDLPLRSRGA